MRSTLRESVITKRILRHLNSLDRCRAVKRPASTFVSGEPDIHGCYRGRALQLEVKRPGERATPRQAAILRKWVAAGAIAGVVHSVDDVKLFLGELS